MGRSLDDVRAVVLTHGDTDHIGFAERLRRERGVPVYVHELDAARARGEVKKPMSGWGPVKVGPLLGFLAYTGRRGGLRITPLTEVVTFTDGVTLNVPGSPRVIALPGHTPGERRLHVPSVDAVFMGDAFTTRSVLTGRDGRAAGAVHARPSPGKGLGLEARRGERDLGAPGPRGSVERRPGRGAAPGPGRRVSPAPIPEGSHGTADSQDGGTATGDTYGRS